MARLGMSSGKRLSQKFGTMKSVGALQRAATNAANRITAVEHRSSSGPGIECTYNSSARRRHAFQMELLYDPRRGLHRNGFL